MEIKVKRTHPNSRLPTRAYEDAACWDMYAVKDVDIAPGTGRIVQVGLCIELPSNWMAIIYARSGHGIKHSLRSHIGIIDADYRGEISPFIFNHGRTWYIFRRNEKCAQLFFQPVPHSTIQEVKELAPSKRGTKGFGSTG